MRAIAYNIQPQEKELLTLANGKRHELTLISNELNDMTVVFAQGKDVVIVASGAVLDSRMMAELRRAGVEKVIIRSTKPLDAKKVAEAEQMGLRVVNTPVPADSTAHIAQKTIEYLHRWESEKAGKGKAETAVAPDENVNLNEGSVKCKKCNR